jgi:hypothetical protein
MYHKIFGDSPLMRSIFNSHWRVAKLLLSREDCNVNMLNKVGLCGHMYILKKLTPHSSNWIRKHTCNTYIISTLKPIKPKCISKCTYTYIFLYFFLRWWWWWTRPVRLLSPRQCWWKTLHRRSCCWKDPTWMSIYVARFVCVCKK